VPIDGKYGRVQLEHDKHIPLNEPGIWFRAQDNHLPAVLSYYRQLCKDHGSPQRHLDLIEETRLSVLKWQATHPTKFPDSETSRAWRN
jgi:hypothetical protein